MKWRLSHGPWFRNAVATVHIHGATAFVRWEAADTENALTDMDRASLSKIPPA
jgi:hypothetical protein